MTSDVQSPREEEHGSCQNADVSKVFQLHWVTWWTLNAAHGTQCGSTRAHEWKLKNSNVFSTSEASL